MNRLHQQILVMGVVALSALAGRADVPLVKYDIELSVARSGYDGVHCWVHARAGIIPQKDGTPPSVVMTMQKLSVTGMDVFGALHDMRTDDLGRTWTGPTDRTSTLGLRPGPDDMTVALSDFWPRWHVASGRLLGIGHTVYYRDNAVVHERPRETGYSIYDPAARAWSPWRTLAMPAEARFHNAGAGCVQRVDLANGDILLPFYFKAAGETLFRAAVARCAFDGAMLSVREIGGELTLPTGRGFTEPSLLAIDGKYLLTLRNDEAGYVTSSRDGLNFDSPRKWTWDDGTELGNYNTQQHWVKHGSAVFLVYTRRGANNDHVFRHRAPLFIAQVDPDRLVVMRDTERILLPERGARLGNFGVTEVSPDEVWVTATEWMQGPSNSIIPPDNVHGADNRVYVAKIRFAPGTP